MKRWIGLGLIVLFACLYRYERVHFSKTQMAGVYERDGLDGGNSYQINADGSFIHFDGKESHAGTWHLVDAEYPLSGTGIEFNGGADSSSYADEYLLTRQGLRICWEVHEEEEYWCKKDDNEHR